MAAFSFGFPSAPAATNPIVFGDPGIGVSDVGDQSTIGQIFSFAQLGAQTFLADQAITSPRPATVTYARNGQLMTVGSGNAAAVAAQQGGLLSFLGTSPGLLLIVMLVLVLVLRK